MIDNYKPIFSKEQITTILKKAIKKNVKSNNKNSAKNDSPYGQKLRESKKICSFYGGLSKKYLQKINHKSVNLPSKISENLFIVLESRLDVVLYRSGFFESIKSAKQMVRIRAIKVNNKIVISPGFFVTPGDIISIFGKYSKKHKYRDTEKRIGFKKKDIFFVNQIAKGYTLKGQSDLKNNRSHVGVGSKETINICKTFVKIKKQILTRKEIRSRYKGSSMLLSTISLAFVYNKMLKAYKNNIKNSTFNIKLVKNKTIEPFSSLVSTPLANAKTENTLAGIDYFYGVIQELGEKGFALEIKKTNGFGLSITFMNTIRNLINFKDPRKGCNNKSQKPEIFFNRIRIFTDFLKINTLYPFVLSPIVTDKLQREVLFGNKGAFKNEAPLKNKDKVYKSKLCNSMTIADSSEEKKPLDFLFMFLNYLLCLKKQYSFLQKKRISNKKQQDTLFFKNQRFFEMKKAKVPHLEVSYKSLSIVFLFPPQRINLPSFFNASLIYK